MVINLIFLSKITIMGDFKINKQIQEEPKYCDYIQQKIGIAKENNATYELDDEDRRIQALYDQQDLVTRDNIKSLDRVLSQGDGKEYLVANKNVEFYTQQTRPDGKTVLVYKDSYSANEGIVNLPIRSVNEDGIEQTNTTRIEYTEPFTASKVDEYIKKAGGRQIQFRFYEGAVTSNRLPNSIPRVGNRDYFVEATWDELQYGKEKKVLDSMISNLPEVRKELNKQNKTTENKEIVINPTTSDTTVTQDKISTLENISNVEGGNKQSKPTLEALNSKDKKSSINNNNNTK
jgi:hypothetical protein